MSEEWTKSTEEAAKKDNFTFNEEKYLYNFTEIKLFGHLVENGVNKSYPKHVAALNDLQQLTTKKELQRIFGLFSYYLK